MDKITALEKVKEAARAMAKTSEHMAEDGIVTVSIWEYDALQSALDALEASDGNR